MEYTVEELKNIFNETFGPGEDQLSFGALPGGGSSLNTCGSEISAFFAPGRVNLIGEHTDYNGGHVFPCALSMGTYALIRKRSDRLIRFYSINFPEEGVVHADLDDIIPAVFIPGDACIEFSGSVAKNSDISKSEEIAENLKDAGNTNCAEVKNVSINVGCKSTGSWTDYPKGVIWAFALKGYRIETGFDMLIWGNIPAGSGLSSSASLEVVTGLALRDTYGFKGISMIDIALIGQFAENNYCNANCGIMDQFASAMGKKDHAIFLDTNTLEYAYAPLDLRDARIVIVNSNVKHSIASSGYNDRRRECEEALSDLRSAKKEEAKSNGVAASGRACANISEMASAQRCSAINTLGDLDEVSFDKIASDIKDEICRKRAKHAVYENQRTIRAVEALKAGDLKAFGKLMNESHASLRDDYETSCAECDFLAETAQKIPGVYGARITGGGFGGCTVNIVKDYAISDFTRIIKEKYKAETGLDAEVYVASVSDGAHRV